MSREYRTERHVALDALAEDPRLSSQAFFGPYRRPRPLTLSKLQRLLRWLRATFQRSAK